MPNIDFSTVATREPLEEGMYFMSVEAAEEKTSSNGNPMILVRFKEPETGTAVFENYVLLPQNLWKLKELADAIGLESDASIDSSELCAMMLGAEVKAKVIQDTYQGNLTNRIKKVFPA